MKVKSKAAEIKALARRHSKAAVKALAAIMNNEDGPATARVSSAQALLDRGWGKAAQILAGEEGGLPVLARIERGLLGVCIREVQKSLKDSSKRLIEAKLKELGLGEADGFKVFEKQIQTPGDGVIIFTGLQDSNNENIKSLEGFQRAWVEEAQV